MTGVRDVRCQIRAVVMCMMLAAAYGAGAVLSENQNSYLLHAAARAGWGDLARDSMARSADPFPVFTALAAPALRAPIFVALGGAFLAAVAVYAGALVGICGATFGWRAVDPAAAFGPTDAGTFRRAAEILADERIALHARVAAWFGPAAILKAAICAVALGFVRRRPIFPLLWPAVVVGVAGSLLLAAFPDPVLALQFPWRVSVWLVPISTALLVGAAVESIHHGVGLRADRWRMPAIVVASLVVAFGIAGTLREARAVDRRIDSPLRAYVAGGAP